MADAAEGVLCHFPKQVFVHFLLCPSQGPSAVGVINIPILLPRPVRPKGVK